MMKVRQFFTILILSAITYASNNWAPILMGDITTFVPYKQPKLCQPGFILLYSIHTDHPNGPISSSGNKVKIYKSCWKKNSNFKHLSIDTAGTFTNSPGKYNMYYSSNDKPAYGYSRYNYYSGTQFNGLSERYMYASRTKSEFITKVTNDIDNKDCKRYADNTNEGNLNSNSNFWVYFCPKTSLLEDLNKL